MGDSKKKRTRTGIMLSKKRPFTEQTKQSPYQQRAEMKWLQHVTDYCDQREVKAYQAANDGSLPEEMVYRKNA